MKKKCAILLCIAMLPVLLGGCFPGDGANSLVDPAGFFSGLWHGAISLISLIYSFFKPQIGIYETFNNGFPYDLGFYIGIGITVGGGIFGGSRKRRRNDW